MATERFLVPKFNSLRDDAEARPKRWTGDRGKSETDRGFHDLRFEFEVIKRWLRLFGRPSADLTQTGPGCKVGVSFFIAHDLSTTANPHLFVDLVPIETESHS